jgi:predicted metal-dependent RNase
MYLRINDLGCKIGGNNRLYSIGATSVLIEWMEGDIVLYRMMLDCGLKNNIDDDFNRVLDTTNIARIRDIMEDKVPGYNSGIQALAVSHCHEDHVGGYPWFYTYCKNKGIPEPRPKLYQTIMTWRQFLPFQGDLYEIFEEPAKNSEYHWDKGIINEISAYANPVDYWTSIPVSPKPQDFEIRLRFIPAGHIVGSAMIEVDTLKSGESLGKILFTGDVCFRDGGFLVDPINQQIITDKYEAVIMEGTYLRNRFAPDEEKRLLGIPTQKENRTVIRENLRKRILDTLGAGGNLVLLVYGIDRTANVLVAIREIIDEGKLGLDLTGKVFLDTKIGGKLVDAYKKNFESFVRSNSHENFGYFRKELVNRSNDGLGPGMLQLAKDQSVIYEYVSGTDHRNSVVEEHRNSSCIVVATSATLEGGTALISGSYMHPDGWGSDPKNLFLIVGGAIPGISASRAIRDFRKQGFADICYNNHVVEEEGGKWTWYNEVLRFSSRLDTLDEFSAHANPEELRDLKRRVSAKKYIVTHIGGNYSPEVTQSYVNDIFMAEMARSYLKGFKVPLRGDVAILDGKHKIIVELKPDEKTLKMDAITYGLLLVKVTKEKGYYGSTTACDVIKRLITEDDQKISKL